VKSPPIGQNFATVGLPCLRRSVGSGDPGTFHSPVSTLTLTLRTHTVTTVHTTQSHYSAPSLTKISVSVYLKNINKELSQQFGVLYTESSGFVSGLNICRALRGQR